MKIALIGKGFLGSKIFDHLIQNHAVDIFKRGFETKALNVYDYIIICVAPSLHDDYENTYYLLTKHILDSLDKPKPILYISSTSVYGPQNGNEVDETTIETPSTEEQKILLNTERLLSKVDQKAIIRFGQIYGHDRDISTMVLKHKVFAGDGLNYCNIIHVDDAARLVAFIVNNQIYGVFNAVSDDHRTRKDLYKFICENLQIPPPIFDTKLLLRHSDNKYVLNNKIKNLGFSFNKPYYQLPLTVAFSFCPNDTFIFGAWVKGLIDSPLNVKFRLADVQTLNELAKNNIIDVTKLSFFTFHRLNEYRLLPYGAALGVNVGPKIVCKEPFSIDDFKNIKVAIPGIDTTANFLFKTFMPAPKEIIYTTYDKILDLIKNGVVDAGVIIHEQRFTFLKEGFYEIVDLGQLWEEKFNLPLPLGCIAVKKTLGFNTFKTVARTLKKSIEYAFKNKNCLFDYIQSNSLEKDPKIIENHINLFVTQDTLKLTKEAKKAMKKLFELSRQKF
jgi:1,4-dihydroxy-6-naphthoate synthase